MRINPMTEDAKLDLLEELQPVVAEFVVALREHGIEQINEVLAKVPEGAEGVWSMLLGAMVNPEQPIKSALNWTESMVDRRKPRLRGGEPPAERERQRLIAAGVPADKAMVLAAREAAEHDTTRSRMLHVIHGERTA